LYFRQPEGKAGLGPAFPVLLIIFERKEIGKMLFSDYIIVKTAGILKTLEVRERGIILYP
jgi:hypothetical protein